MHKLNFKRSDRYGSIEKYWGMNTGQKSAFTGESRIGEEGIELTYINAYF
jgi:hypothetical protein